MSVGDISAKGGREEGMVGAAKRKCYSKAMIVSGENVRGEKNSLLPLAQSPRKKKGKGCREKKTITPF